MLMIPNSGYLMETSVAAYRISNYSLPRNLNWWLIGRLSVIVAIHNKGKVCIIQFPSTLGNTQSI